MRANNSIIIIGCIVFFACSNINEPKNSIATKDTTSIVLTPKIKDSISFENFVLGYVPHNVDISKDLNDTLGYFDIAILFREASVLQKERWINILLLKQYLHHLKASNQGYDLYSMRKGETTIIINEFIAINRLDSIGEFLNSGYIVEAINKRGGMLLKDQTIGKLLAEIDKEVQRINK